MHDERSVVVLKPDGFHSCGVRGIVAAHLDSRELLVTKIRQTILTSREIIGLWPIFGSRKHPLFRELYLEYMSSGPCEALLVEGRNALAKCLNLKKKVRRHFEICAFENAIHTAAHPLEAAANEALLFGGVEDAPPPEWPEWGKRGAFGRLADASTEEVRNIAQSIWRDRVSLGWAGIMPQSEIWSACATHRSILRPGDPNSIDYGISLLLEVLPNLGLNEVVRCYISAEVQGGAAISWGSREKMDQLSQALAQHQMTVDVEATGCIGTPFTTQGGHDVR